MPPLVFSRTGVINEVWVDTDEEEPAIMAHIDFEDGDEEDVELAEAPQYVADKKKQKHMLQDLEELINKRKKNKNKRVSTLLCFQGRLRCTGVNGPSCVPISPTGGGDQGQLLPGFRRKRLI